VHAPKENPPALLPVTDNRGILLGTALYSPSSQIVLRLVSRELIPEAQWLALLAQRLRAAIARRGSMLNEANNAARLVFSEADNLPGIVIDKYAGIIILQLLAKGLDNEATRRVCVETISSAFPSGTLTLWERPDPRIRQLENLSAPATTPLYHRGAAEPEASTIFRINGLSFHFDAQTGQKTGAFLDQRQNYAAAASWAQLRGIRNALDICTYQGGFALHLAEAGCQVTAVDQSHASLEVAERNLELNRNEKHLPAETEIEWLEADAFELLRDWAAQKRDSSQTAESSESENTHKQWQMIILDPPAFAKSQRAVEGALRGYKELNLRALQLLAPGGLLVTCSCSHHVSLSELENTIASAAADAGRRVTLLERRGAAHDHPTVLNLPETEYLKCLILSVD
jgi:23S rRNA (cytosine1962-C5)-methyltransferase